MDALKLKVDEFIEKHNNLEDKIDDIIAKYNNLDSKFNIFYNCENTLEDINNNINCNCDIYTPFIVNGPCRFCYKVNSQ